MWRSVHWTTGPNRGTIRSRKTKNIGAEHGQDIAVLIAGTRIVEWSEGISAPFGARILGDIGADIVKIETPEGDPLRRREPFWPGETGAEASALFAYVNAGKRSRTLDLAVAADRDRMHGLLADAAILIESQPAARLRALGLDVAALQARHPHLVVLSITPFGRVGPLAESPATDFTLQHRAAFAYNMARPVDEPQARGPLAGADHEGPLAVGVAGAMAAMWGLLVAQTGGKPPHIDLASHDFYAHIAFEGLADWLRGERVFTRRRVKREGTEAAGGLTWILPCAHGWVMVSPREQHQWDRWVALLGHPDWSKDAALCGTRVDRRRNFFELQEHMAAWSQTLPPDEVARRAQAVSVACFPVSTPGELLENAQLRHRELFDRLVSTRGAAARVPGLPFRVETTGNPVLSRARTRRAPTLGEADGEVAA
jgi:crotonobetainyl-CoA:carnitine CoA-transferase CaiB-like acyl-CoA transferase